MTRRRGARNTYGSITEDKRRRSQSRGSVREASAQPPSAEQYSYASIPQTPADEEWAAARAKSPSAAGFKAKYEASMQEMRDRTRTDLARPRSPSRQASRQTSYSRSFSRRSGDGDTDDGNDDPDIMEAVGTIGRSVSVARPQSAPLRLHETTTLTPIQAPAVRTAGLPRGRAQRMEALGDTPKGMTPAAVLESREESIRRSQNRELYGTGDNPQPLRLVLNHGTSLMPRQAPRYSEESIQRSQSRELYGGSPQPLRLRLNEERTLEPRQEPEDYVRPPDDAYTERLVKGSPTGSPTGFAKREAWSGDRSMPAALESVSVSRSITPGGTISHQALLRSRTRSNQLRDALPLGQRRGLHRSTTREPEDVPQDVGKRSASRLDVLQEHRRSYSTEYDPFDPVWAARISFPTGVKREGGMHGFQPMRKQPRGVGPTLSPYVAQKQRTLTPRQLSPGMQNAPMRRTITPEMSPKFGRKATLGATYDDDPMSKRLRSDSLFRARAEGRPHPGRRRSRGRSSQFSAEQRARMEHDLSTAQLLEEPREEPAREEPLLEEPAREATQTPVGGVTPEPSPRVSPVESVRTKTPVVTGKDPPELHAQTTSRFERVKSEPKVGSLVTVPEPKPSAREKFLQESRERERIQHHKLKISRQLMRPAVAARQADRDLPTSTFHRNRLRGVQLELSAQPANTGYGTIGAPWVGQVAQYMPPGMHQVPIPWQPPAIGTGAGAPARLGRPWAMAAEAARKRAQEMQPKPLPIAAAAPAPDPRTDPVAPIGKIRPIPSDAVHIDAFAGSVCVKSPKCHLRPYSSRRVFVPKLQTRHLPSQPKGRCANSWVTSQMT